MKRFGDRTRTFTCTMICYSTSLKISIFEKSDTIRCHRRNKNENEYSHSVLEEFALESGSVII